MNYKLSNYAQVTLPKEIHKSAIETITSCIYENELTPAQVKSLFYEILQKIDYEIPIKKYDLNFYLSLTERIENMTNENIKVLEDNLKNSINELSIINDNINLTKTKIMELSPIFTSEILDLISTYSNGVEKRNYTIDKIEYCKNMLGITD